MHTNTRKSFSCGMWRLKSKKSIVKLKRVARCHTTLRRLPSECLFTNAHPHTHRRRPNFESHPDNGKHVENVELSLALVHSLLSQDHHQHFCSSRRVAWLKTGYFYHPSSISCVPTVAQIGTRFKTRPSVGGEQFFTCLLQLGTTTVLQWF